MTKQPRNPNTRISGEYMLDDPCLLLRADLGESQVKRGTLGYCYTCMSSQQQSYIAIARQATWLRTARQVVEV
jgi:hypothetical protein